MFHDLLPSWVMQGLEGAELDQVQDMHGSMKEYLMPFALLSTGVCHIFHNASKRIGKSLPSWDRSIRGLRPLTYLIHKPHLRQRLVGTLIVGTVHSNMERFFDKGCSKLATWRWGTVAAIISELLRFRNVLPLVWAPKKFSCSAAGKENFDEHGKYAFDFEHLPGNIRYEKAHK